jgi:lipopolysaccharide biosynthesis glycosyltransferase
MKTAICTISTQSHIFKSYTLYKSILPFFDGDFFCLISDSKIEKWEDNITIHNLEILQSEIAVSIIKKYKGDKLRWALKPIYLKYLLQKGYDKVIYVDNDIFFFQSPNYLFEMLNNYSVLLTPHFYPTNPKNNQNWLEANFRIGIYNAGFIGINQKAIPFLDWWGVCCLYNLKKSYWRGLFDDQKYLDLVPIIFEDVFIIKDSGYNQAGWNDGYRMKKLGGANLQTVVFVHFAEITLQRFSVINSPFYKLYVEYIKEIKKNNPLFVENFGKYSKRNILEYFYFLIWKLARRFD